MSFARILCAVGLTLVVGTAEAAPPRGTPLFIELPSEVLPSDLGAGGFVVLGSFFSGGGLMWLPTSGVIPIGGRSGVAISRDGKTIAGNALDARGLENAAIWTGGRDWRTLGSFTANAQPCDLLLSATFGASDDGKVLVGLGWNGCRFAHAFRWEESTGMVDLGTSVPGESTRANNVSGDGRVVVGWQEDVTGFRQGAKWVDRVQELIRGPRGLLGEAFAANRDGSLIVGGNCDPFNVNTPSGWSWTAAGGVTCYPVTPPRLPNVPRQVLIQATSDDGRVFGGAMSFGLESESLVWFDGEAFYLKDYLRANGVPSAFEGWVNTGFVRGITPDGRTLVGYGAGPRAFQGFMVVLPELAPK